MSARLYRLLLWSMIGGTALCGAVAAGRLHPARSQTPTPAPEAALPTPKSPVHRIVQGTIILALTLLAGAVGFLLFQMVLRSWGK